METRKFREEVRSWNENIPQDVGELATKIALKTILRRVRAESATEIKSFLPEEWQSEMQFAGELDTSVTSATVLNEIGSALNISSERAGKILTLITRTLAKFIPPDILFRAFMQLPFEMRSKIEIGDERLHAKDIDTYTIQPDKPKLHATSIADFLNKKVIVLKSTVPLRSAAMAMAENNVGCVLVSDAKGGIVGILTDRDLASISAVVENGLEAHVGEAMSEGDLVTVEQGDDLRSVIDKMIDYGVRRIPVVKGAVEDTRMRCVGIVSLDDLLMTKSISIDDASRIAAQQIHPTPHRASRAALRSIARKMQTAIRFNRNLASKLGLDEKTAEHVTKIVLKTLVRRINSDEARHLISQLPSIWQDELHSLAIGPDKSIQAQEIVEDLARYVRISTDDAGILLNKIVNAIAELTSRGEIVDLVSQLPSDMQRLLDIRPGLRDGRQPAGRSGVLPFRDREDGARHLLAKLQDLKDQNPLVLAVPRGAVPMAKIIAEALDGELDLIFVKKIGHPLQPEFALGAVSEDGEIILSHDLKAYGVTREEFERAAMEQLESLRNKRAEFTPGRGPLDVKGRTTIVIDDGIATGATTTAAVRMLKVKGARRIIVATPVASRQAVDRLQKENVDVRTVAVPDRFTAVGHSYRNFTQVSDAEVGSLLRVNPNNEVKIGTLRLKSIWGMPENPIGLVLFAHGSGSGRLSPRNQFVAETLNKNDISTLLVDLLTEEESHVRANTFNIDLLAERLIEITEWIGRQENLKSMKIGYFGASTGAAAALVAAAKLGQQRVTAVVSRGGRPDLAQQYLAQVRAPTLLIVGERDDSVIELNQKAYQQLQCERKIEIVPQATHLFEEPGTLEIASELAVAWFRKYFSLRS
jgi:putative phosphoribosyl transferase